MSTLAFFFHRQPLTRLATVDVPNPRQHPQYTYVSKRKLTCKQPASQPAQAQHTRLQLKKLGVVSAQGAAGVDIIYPLQ